MAIYLAWCTVASILNAYQLAISWRWLSRPRILCRSDPDQHPCRVGYRDPIAGGRLRYCAGVGVLEHRRRAAGGASAVVGAASVATLAWAETAACSPWGGSGSWPEPVG